MVCDGSLWGPLPLLQPILMSDTSPHPECQGERTYQSPIYLFFSSSFILIPILSHLSVWASGGELPRGQTSLLTSFVSRFLSVHPVLWDRWSLAGNSLSTYSVGFQIRKCLFVYVFITLCAEETPPTSTTVYSACLLGKASVCQAVTQKSVFKKCF